MFIFFYLGFLSGTFANHRTAGEGRGHSINSSLLLLPASQTLRYLPGDYCRDLTSAHNQKLDLNRKPLVSEDKSLTTKLRALCTNASKNGAKTVISKYVSNNYTLREETSVEEIFWEDIFAEFIFATLNQNCENKYHNFFLLGTNRKIEYGKCFFIGAINVFS